MESLIFIKITEIPSESYEKLNTFKSIIKNESFIDDENYLYLEKNKNNNNHKWENNEIELNKNNLYYEIGEFAFMKFLSGYEENYDTIEEIKIDSYQLKNNITLIRI